METLRGLWGQLQVTWAEVQQVLPAMSAARCSEAESELSPEAASKRQAWLAALEAWSEQLVLLQGRLAPLQAQLGQLSEQWAETSREALDLLPEELAATWREKFLAAAQELSQGMASELQALQVLLAQSRELLAV